SYDKELSRRTVLDLGGPIPFLDVKGGKILTCRFDETSLPEVFLGTLEDPAGEEISFLNEEVLKDKFVSEPVLVPYESCGLSLHGWVLLPEGFRPIAEGGEKASIPAILDVHGGPRCVYTSAFFHEMQVWVSRGYAVFFTNIKGSDGRGDEFADIRGDYGNTDFRNLMDFTDEVLRLFPEIDPERVCETGGSYGGFMTNWIITHTDRFKACASQRSISNWISKTFISDIGTFFNPDQCGAKGVFGEENTKALWDHSPLKYAENVKTPTLFIHSDQDYRWPLPEGIQMMEALVVRGVPARLVLFHGENHELSRSGKPFHRLRRLREITEWFDRYTKKE
ncbi:MAG: S9 family peptidase, partial [Lachnospiraceae bacterium]|nr:S9 family peptidase [Lachnospiraceae bacterium]